MLYVFPIILLIIGAIIGQQLGAVIDLNTSASSALVGFLFFIFSVRYIKSKANKMAQQDRYRPRIVRILKQQ